MAGAGLQFPLSCCFSSLLLWMYLPFDDRLYSLFGPVAAAVDSPHPLPDSHLAVPDQAVIGG